MTVQRPLPLLSPAEERSDPFWSEARERRLTFQECEDCSRAVFYPRRHCPWCGSSCLRSQTSAGLGRVYSYTIVRAHPSEYFAGRVPYAVAIVSLDEGFRMIAEVTGDADLLQIGAQVSLDWDTSQELPVPIFHTVG